MSESRDWLNLPNKITITRLIIAVLLFVMLSLEIADSGLGDRSLALNIAFWVFIVCVATDWLDGWIARRQGLVTAFGRIADPFVDKVVVCGAFIYLVELAPDLIKPWFAVTIVAREFLVSGLRSYVESLGIPFGSRLGGKLKMICQSTAIPVVLFYQANYSSAPEGDSGKMFFYWLAWALVAATLLTTLVTAWDYMVQAVKVLRAHGSARDGNAS